MAIRIPTEDSVPTVAFEEAVHCVFELLDSIHDFRDPKGKQIELRGTLALAILATTAGHPGYTDMEQWGKCREEGLIPLLGLVRAPSDSTIRRILQGIDPDALRGVLQKSAAMIPSDKRKLVIAKDGKTMRAARGRGRTAGPAHPPALDGREPQPLCEGQPLEGGPQHLAERRGGVCHVPSAVDLAEPAQDDLPVLDRGHSNDKTLDGHGLCRSSRPPRTGP